MTPTAEETAAAVELKKKELADAEAAHKDAVENAPPREPAIVLGDLLTHIVARFGNHVDLQELLDEYRATLPKAEEPPATK